MRDFHLPGRSTVHAPPGNVRDVASRSQPCCHRNHEGWWQCCRCGDRGCLRLVRC